MTKKIGAVTGESGGLIARKRFLLRRQAMVPALNGGGAPVTPLIDTQCPAERLFLGDFLEPVAKDAE